MDFANILSGLPEFAEKKFLAFGKLLPYHNLEHTKSVVEAVNKMCDHYNLNEVDRFILNTAAWFHDLGINEVGLKNHEKESVAMAETWLAGNKVPDEIIQKVKSCILSTEIPQNPKSLSEKILADADLWYLGTDDYNFKHKLLKQEMAVYENREINGDEWRERNLAFLTTHHYHTDYAKKLLQPKKDEHIERLKEKLEKKSNGTEEKGKKKKKDKDQDPNIPTRGIETMFKVTIHNHLELSSMADSKANIMISVNSIIVSVVLSVLLRRLEERPELIIPTCILLAVNVLTIVFAILSVRPKILKSSKQPVEEQADKRANLLFFGSFNKLSLDVYTQKMKGMMGDKDYLYENMINNIYFMGIVLGRKYHWLRIAYNVFMYGFILAVLSFALAMVL